MRVPVLPRDVAASVSVLALARGGWAIAGVTLLITIPGTIELFRREGYAGDSVGPVIGLAIMVAALALAAFRTSRTTLVIFLVAGAVGEYLFLYSVLSRHSALLSLALVLLNRPACALVLVGTAGKRPLPAILWGIGGFVVAEAVTVLVCLQLGIGIQTGNGPAVTLANYAGAYLGLSLIQRAQRGRVPDFLRLRQETRRLEAERTADQRAVALLHDTVLNDLAIVVNGPDVLDQRASMRMLRDVAILTNTRLVEDEVARNYVDAGDASLRNRLMGMVTDFQWRGLSVEVTGDTGVVAHIEEAAVEAAVGALQAALENVLAHSGASSAEIIVGTTADSVTWTVSDAGVGFDRRSVPSDRLGLRSSIVQRVEAAGGAVRVFSSPGNGTSVVFTLPLVTTDEADEFDEADDDE